MLEKTFVHVQGIGYATERRLWEAGADCWSSFLADPARFKPARSRLALTLDVIHRSREALARGDQKFFSERLQPRDQWRALPAFEGRVGYLDIETDGGTGFESVTVIGLYHRNQLYQFVRERNLLEFEEVVGELSMLVTFFGSGFDLPVLKTLFPRLRFEHLLHLDLCPALRRLGLAGGLKSIERQLGMQRSPETGGLSGWDAVRLWNEWRWGRESSLRTLLNYNAEDVLNMVPLAELAYRELAKKTTLDE